ncbi:DUF4124 domain-containing protein [Halieaceae bacterium IMCC14734]|uniref:DUF4124 domain-containing protein n=1 Tax=Candidatus Litorirhabdus singularis TaxID=2518993 RepID=A0ABT3TC11_9GAMM|nr:DUF4124 domain-containing protein [Candidatus Litorirhabdus singularis]MCX2979828.1 DUF4124 domain-containing protein [Candidatus Litorirhabdus singularis]
MPRLLLLLLLLSPLLATAQVYKHVDQDGNVTFSDIPAPGSEKIDVPVSNTVAAPPVVSRPQEEPADALVSYQVAISSPEPEAVIPRGPGNFSVTVTVSPAPDTSMQLQLFMDGDAYGAPQSQLQWNLTNVPRGTHQVQVAIVDSEGETLAQSDPITVYVRRPSKNF